MSEDVPCFEKLKFVSIFTSNLDEFFMVRVGSLFDLSIDHANNCDSKTGMTPAEQLDKIYEAVEPLYEKRDAIYKEVLLGLRQYGVQSLSMNELSNDEAKFVREYYNLRILPILSPQVVDATHPFPFVPNKQLNILLSLGSKKSRIFGIIPVPDILPQVIFMPGDRLRYIHISDIILKYAAELFQMYEVGAKNVFCVTRNADISPDDEDFAEQGRDFRSVMKLLVKKRKRLAVVRVESKTKLSQEMRNMLIKRLGLRARQFYVTETPMNLSYVFSMESRLPEQYHEKLCYRHFSPQNAELCYPSARKKGDMLLSYPYDSMRPFLELIKKSAYDPNVISIKITIYRLAKNSKLVEYLCAAAENGKEVLVLIELRARFDEQNNIDWSERLEQSGVRVIYGFEQYKVHSKVCLITRDERGGHRFITQIGTGNYNEKTAEQYTDMCLITEDQEIGSDASEFFKNMSVGELEGEYKHLWVAPHSMRSRIIEQIDGQIEKGTGGLVVMKVNSVTDLQLIEKLREASQAGVRIDLLVRGICCILPGAPGFTDNIRVVSIVGRFLEHTRIYSFGWGEGQKLYISSADAMTRNMQRRVEVACPIYNRAVKDKINHVLELSFRDTVKARRLTNNGLYEPIRSKRERINSQETLMREAVQSSVTPVKKKKGPFGRWLKRLISRAYKKYVLEDN